MEKIFFQLALRFDQLRLEPFDKTFQKQFVSYF